MPQAVAAAVVAFVGITGTAAAIATTVVAVGISFGLSYAASSLFGPKAQGSAPQPKPSDRQFISKNPIARRSRSYGRVRVSGAQMFAYAKSGTFYRLLAHNTGRIDGYEKFFLDGYELTLGSDGWVTSGHHYVDGRPRARVLTRLGNASETSYSQLTAAYAGWDEDHRGDGIASTLTMMRQVPQDKFFETWPNGENATFKVQLRGARVFDPRDDTTAWSENAALCIRDYLLHETGFGMPSAWIDAEDAAWRAEATACGEIVAGDVPRFSVSYTYDFDRRPADVLSDLLRACNGRIMIGENGGLRLVSGRWVEPSVTIDATMIEDYTLSAGPDGTGDATIIKGVYVSPGHGYVEQEAQPWIDAAAVAARGEIVAELDLTAVPSHAQARRLMKQASMKGNPEWTGQLVTNLGALPALTERFVVVALDIGETFFAEIDSIDPRTEQPGVITGLVISFTSVVPSAFAAEAGDDGLGANLPPDTSGIGALPAMVGLSASADTDRVITVTWTAHADDSLRTDVHIRRSTVSTWSIIGTANSADTDIDSGTLVAGASYYVRARTRGITNRVGAWTTIGPIAVP